MLWWFSAISGKWLLASEDSFDAKNPRTVGNLRDCRHRLAPITKKFMVSGAHDLGGLTQEFDGGSTVWGHGDLVSDLLANSPPSTFDAAVFAFVRRFCPI